MAQRFAGDGWSIEVPQGWTVREEDECVHFVPPGRGDGMRLTAARKGEGRVKDADLVDFASEHLDAGAPRRDVRLGDFVGFEIAFDTDDLAVREWTLRAGNVLLFVSYGCVLQSAGRLDEAVEQALITLTQGSGGPG